MIGIIEESVLPSKRALKKRAQREKKARLTEVEKRVVTISENRDARIAEETRCKAFCVGIGAVSRNGLKVGTAWRAIDRMKRKDIRLPSGLTVGCGLSLERQKTSDFVINRQACYGTAHRELFKVCGRY